MLGFQKLAQDECCNFQLNGPRDAARFCVQAGKECRLFRDPIEECFWFGEAVGPQDGGILNDYMDSVGQTGGRKVVCAQCGHVFRAQSPGEKYCTEGCRLAARAQSDRMRKREVRRLARLAKTGSECPHFGSQNPCKSAT